MIRRYGGTFRALLMLADVGLAALLALGVSWILFGVGSPMWRLWLPSPELALLMFVAAWATTLWLHGGYRLRARWSLASEAHVIVRSAASLAVVTFAFLYLARLPEVSRLYLVVLFGVLVAMTVFVRGAMRLVFEWARRQGRNRRTILVLGTGELAVDFARKVEEHPELGLQVVGFVGDDRWAAAQPILGPLSRFPEIVHSNVVDEVAICLRDPDFARIEQVVRLCEEEGRIVRMPVPIPRLALATSHVEDLDGTPVLSFVINPRTALALVLKRGIDLAGAFVGLVLLTPLFAAIAAAIAITDGRPVLYRQIRVGLHGREFSVVKFRSMVRDADQRLHGLREHNELNGQAFKITNDPRITAVGRFLRRSSLDELPQLWNVLRGEMSLVGPRPPLPEEVAAYDSWHRRRLSMKPGITGLWQIEGRREAEFDRWVEKDLEYIDRWSPWLDIRILLRTIPAVLRAEGR